jgi:adenylate cyclase
MEAAQKREAEVSRRLVRRTLGSLYAALVLVVYVAGVALYALADLRAALFSDRLPGQHPYVAVVAITDQTLSGFKARLPIDRHLLARLIDAVDAAGAKAIGLDIIFFRTTPADNEDMLIDAIRRSRAKVVLAAADERLGLSAPQTAGQSAFLDEAGRSAGYVNIAIERDRVVRFKAEPAPGSRFPKSFAQLLVEAFGFRADTFHRRIAWLREPADGSNTFLTVPADTLLLPAGDPLGQAARYSLKDKIVIIGGLLPDVDEHLTPLTTLTHETMPGPLIHAHITAELVDGRGGGFLEEIESNSLFAWLGLACLIAVVGFVIGWRYRLTRRGILLGRLATVVFLALALILQRGEGVVAEAFLILPIERVLLAWLIGELSGHYLGRWLGAAQG